MKKILVIAMLCISLFVVLSGCSKPSGIVYFDEVSPTTISEGTKEYWKDLATGKIYSDCNLEKELNAPIIIPKINSEETNDYFYDEQFHWKHKTYSSDDKIKVEAHDFEDGVCKQCGYNQNAPNWKTTELMEHKLNANLIINYLNKEKEERLINMATSERRDVPDFFGEVVVLSGEQNAPIENTNKVTTYILNNITYSGNDPFIKSTANSKCFIVIPQGTYNSIKSKDDALSFVGDVYICGSGCLCINSQKNGIKVNNICIIESNIDIRADSNGIEANAVEMESVKYESRTRGDGIYCQDYIYANNSTITLNSQGEYIEYSEENKQEYNLSDEDFIYNERDGYYGMEKNRGLLAYAIARSSKGLHIAAEEDSFNRRIEMVTNGIYLYSCCVNANTTDDCFGVTFGNIVLKQCKLTCETLGDAIRTDGILMIEDTEYEVVASYEGVEAGYIEIDSSTIKICSNDDCIEASSYYGFEGWAIVKSSSVMCISEADDGFDTQGDTLVIDSNITLYGSYHGEGFDLDSKLIVVSGEIFTMSSYGGEIYTNQSKQCMVELTLSTKLEKGELLSLKTKDNRIVFEGEALALYGLVVFSSELFSIGDEYDIFINNSFASSIVISGLITRIVI